MNYKIFFVDLNYYRPGKTSVIPFPLSVAYMASYLCKMVPDHFKVHLIKDPHQFLKLVDQEKPVLAAFSNYIWNHNLQMEAALHIKRKHASCVTLMGGPNFNFSESEWMDSFARKYGQIDFFIEGEGETKFLNVVRCGLAHSFDAWAMKQANPAGTAFIHPTHGYVHNSLAPTATVWNSLDPATLDIQRGCLVDVNDVPSPYLTGLMDDFLRDPDFCPIVETNRGCPYSCTFCNWGAMGKSKSKMFDLKRITDEFHYIARNNVGQHSRFYIGDANFGLFERDEAIAHLLVELHNRYGFPEKLFMYFAKNSSNRILRIGNILKRLVRSNLTISRQSMNDQVLANIKRSNIKMDTFTSLGQLAKELDVETKVELIYTLPGESKESFFNGIQRLGREHIDSVHLYPAMLLNGSEMGSKASREKFGLKGEFRLIDGSLGTFGPLSAMEFEELITQTDAMTREEHLEIRLFHFFQYLFLDIKLFKNVEVFMPSGELLQLVERLVRGYRHANTPLRTLVEDFIRQASLELRPTVPDRITKEEVNKAMTDAVKLNPLYTVKLLFDPGVRMAFYRFVKDEIMAMVSPEPEAMEAVFDFMDACIYPFDGLHVRKCVLKLNPLAIRRHPNENRGANGNIILSKPHEFVFFKKNTYQDLLDNGMEGLTMTQKIYHIMTHHSNESYGDTLSYSLELGKES
ncbi:MAG: B12-binding protein [Magnetococcales bacterium]|nr:B12-binding protein [Magnetococcales bacterium]HIJ85951.1 hypothetical protein [Magnetococcales bacterium]